jgi:hypothetical protein
MTIGQNAQTPDFVNNPDSSPTNLCFSDGYFPVARHSPTPVLHRELLRGDRPALGLACFIGIYWTTRILLLFPRQLAKGEGIHRGCPPDVCLFRARRKLSRAIHMASVDESQRRIDMKLDL